MRRIVVVAVLLVMLAQAPFAETDQQDRNEIVSKVEDAIDKCGCDLGQPAGTKVGLIGRFGELVSLKLGSVAFVTVGKLLRFEARDLEFRVSVPYKTKYEVIEAWEECVNQAVGDQPPDG